MWGRGGWGGVASSFTSGPSRSRRCWRRRIDSWFRRGALSWCHTGMSARPSRSECPHQPRDKSAPSTSSRGLEGAPNRSSGCGQLPTEKQTGRRQSVAQNVDQAAEQATHATPAAHGTCCTQAGMLAGAPPSCCRSNLHRCRCVRVCARARACVCVREYVCCVCEQHAIQCNPSFVRIHCVQGEAAATSWNLESE